MKRIYQVAKEFQISNDTLMEFLKKQNLKISNIMAPIPEPMYELVLEHFKKVAPEPDKTADFRKRLQEKKDVEEARKQVIKKEIDEILKISQEAPPPPPVKPSKAAAKTEPMKTAEPIQPEKTAEKVHPDKPSERSQTPKVEKPIQPETSQERSPADKISKPGPVTPSRQMPPGGYTAPPIYSGKGTPKTSPVSGKQAPPPKGPSAPDKKGPTDETKPKRHLKRLPHSDEEPGKIRVVEEDSDFGGRGRKKHVKDQQAPVLGVQGAHPHRKKKKKKKSKNVIDQQEIDKNIKETLDRMGQTAHRKRYRKEKTEDGELLVEDNIIKTAEFITVAELAHLMEVEPSEVIKACMSLGLLVSINQRLDRETIVMVADEFEFEVRFMTEFGEEHGEAAVEEEEDDPALLKPRAPVVTIMGHVDHGKTSLLDYIRSSNIIAGEAGGITQHIGAYEVTTGEKKITFLDTPGHEAFTAMRARGAQATDIVVLVVAADDNVMPQTVEAINHAKAAGVPIVVAINKMDKPGANADMIKTKLSDHNVLVENWGGKVQCAEVSAKTGAGVDRLLDLILLEAEVLELKANPNRKAKAVLIEARLDRGKGVVGTVLVQKGTLRKGDLFVAGQYWGRVRAMFDERGNAIEEAPPSTPVQILGFNGMPQAGDVFVVMDSEQEARETALKRQQLKREQTVRQVRRITLDQISKRIAEGEVKELSVIIKADMDGSVEALSGTLMELGTEDVSVRIIHKGVGSISESDVLLAEASQAVIIGFHVSPNVQAKELAQRESVDIRLYKIIYNVVEDIKKALSGLLEPEKSEEILGTVEIREMFKASRVGNIAGCYVLTGKVTRNNLIRIKRDGQVLFEGKLSTLKRFKEDVREVAAGFECGITVDGFNQIEVGDTIEAYQVVETARTL
jgi:translation initiation factor IF-2